MIGQKNLINKLNSISIDKFPRFLVLVGDKGSGKTTLSHLIADNLKAEFALSGIKVDEIDRGLSFGVCLSYDKYAKECYLYINLIKWGVSIGWLTFERKEE